MAEDADWRLTAQGFYADALYENGDFGRVRVQTVWAGGAGGDPRSTPPPPFHRHCHCSPPIFFVIVNNLYLVASAQI
jgi:hypothetical protein